MPILAKKKLFTTQYYDDYRKGKRKFAPSGMRPTSPHRRNNPHPQSEGKASKMTSRMPQLSQNKMTSRMHQMSKDFLEPKNIKEQDAQMALQHRVQRAVHDYVLKSIGEGNFNNIKKIMEHREYPQLTQSLPAARSGQGPGISVHPNQTKHVDLDGFIKSSLNILEEGKRTDKKELKRERGNHYKAAAKTYGQIPATPRPPSVRYQTPVRKPLLDISTQSMAGSKTKRTHTPPTPPLQARRPKSAAYEAQVAALATADEPRPALYRSKTAPGQDEIKGEGNDNEIDDGKEVEESHPAPKSTTETLGPRMKAWVEGATDFEKDVAYNMLQSLNGVQPVPRPQAPANSMMNPRRMAPPSRQGGRIPAATHVYVPPSPAPRQAVPNRNGRDDAQVQSWMKQLREKLELQQPAVLEVRQLPKSMAAPNIQARKKRVTIPEEYRHENSHFMMTKPPYRRHFIIAPDWVSERTSHRRLQQQGWARKNRIGNKGVGY